MSKIERGKDSLAHKAALTVVSQLLQQGSRFISSFVVTPIVVHGLGAELYGIWNMIQQSLGYLSLSDFRPMATLKYTLAVQQHIEDSEAKRRQIGSALFLWAFSFPLFCILGVIAIWKLPGLIHVKAEYFKGVQIAIGILILCAATDKLLSLPATVLRGMNLEYKAMGLNAAIILLNAGIIVLAIKMRLGLPGIAAASFTGLLIAGATRLWVVRNALSWFGISKPQRKELIIFSKLTGWLVFLSLGGLLFNGSELLIIGRILKPTMVAIYVTTGSALLVSTDLLAQLLGSANSGLVGICGQGDWKRAMAIRLELYSFGTAGIVLIGTGVLLLNKFFVTLWVGPQFYGGLPVTFCLVLAATSKLLLRIDNIMISGFLEIKRLSVSTFICGALTVILGFMLIKWLGLKGMPIAAFCAVIIQWGHFQIIIRERTKYPLRSICIPFFKLLIATLPAYFLAIICFRFIHIRKWFDFILLSVPISFVILGYTWFLVLGTGERNMLKYRIKAIYAFK